MMSYQYSAMSRSLTVVGVLLSTVALGVPRAGTAQALSVTEWLVPWPESRPRDPYVDGTGLVWFVGQRSDYLASFSEEGEKFQRFDLPPGTGPHNLIVDEDGQVWFAGNRVGYIGRLDPETGDIVEYPMPEAEAGDPHTLVFDGRGHIWFTVQQGNFIGRLTMATGLVELVAIPTPQSRPYGIVVDPDGRPWATLFGTSMLATVDPVTMTLGRIETPRADARIRRVGLTSDGGVWYVDYQQGYLGRYDPESGDIQEWEAPGARQSRPYAMAVDDADRIWFVETGLLPNRLVGFDPAREEFFSVTEIPSGGRSVRHMFYDRSTQTLWFGTDANTLGKAVLK
jgi:virginiamycin B lyase